MHVRDAETCCMEHARTGEDARKAAHLPYQQSQTHDRRLKH